MTEIETKHFGRVSIDAGVLVEFPLGLPAFETEHEFLAIEHPRAEPLILLQSTVNPHLCFLALPVAMVEPAYQLQVSCDDLHTLDLEEGTAPAADLAVLALVVVGTQNQVSANLMSPIVVNRANRRAVQAVRWDGAYPHNHPVATLAAVAGEAKQPCL